MTPPITNQHTELVVTFRDLLPGIISRVPRIPSLLKTVFEMKTVSMNDINSVGMVIERNAAMHPEKRALLYEDQVFTHKELNEAVNRYANYFISEHIQKGDVVGVFMENRPELVMIISALAKVGAIASLINPNQTGKILLHSVNITCKNLFIVGEEMRDAFEEIRPDLNLSAPAKIYFLADGSDMKPPEGYLDLTRISGGFPLTNPSTTKEIRLKDPFAYVFTSGTTGLPKASIQLNFKWVGAGRWFGRFNMDLTSDDTMYIPLPFYHTNGLHVAWATAAISGAAIAIRRKFSASNFWNDTRKFNTTTFMYIGEILRYLMNQPPKSDDRDNPVKKIVGNGLRPDIWKQFKKRFDIPHVYEFYGAAEGPSIFTNFFNIDCSVGLCPTPYAIAEYDIDDGDVIRDQNGFLKKVKPGRPGLMLTEITNLSPYIGYTNKEESDKKVFRDVFKKGDMWFNTGDLMREIGLKHLQFVDRLGDTFRWKGENVSTTEVEEMVNQIDGISSATAYGVAIPGTDGRAGMVSIITDTLEDDINKKELAQRLKKDLPSYAVPIFIRVKTQFETTATFKIKKTNLKTDGFDPEKIPDPLYVLLPGEDEYTPLAKPVYDAIIAGKYKL
ncbi:MAG: long-chain-acyl-CoA synthetase [Proteobacteria bacterium]|nr:long-chain-acyl-CoA synthetase [Pseudomonadota bacterium]